MIRRLLLPDLSDLDVAAAEFGWRPGFAPVDIDWPTAEYQTVEARWRDGDAANVSVIADGLVARRYLVVSGAAAFATGEKLWKAGIAVAPNTVIDAATRSSNRWEELGDTLYDLVVGAFDSTDRDVADLWTARLSSAHPLVRHAACLAAPYLDGAIVRAGLEHAAADKDEIVRRVAAHSLAVMRLRK